MIDQKFCNTIILGDCMKIMRDMPKNSIDAIITNPPYDLKLNAKSSQPSGVTRREAKAYNHIYTDINWTVAINDFLIVCDPLMKRFNGYFWCSANQLAKYIDFAAYRGYFYDVLVWHKVNPIPFNKNTYLSDLEYCVFIREAGSTFNNGGDFNNYRKCYSSGGESIDGHPTPKPVPLMKRHIAVSSNPGDLILDPFAGSGSSLVAAKENGRNYLGIEINPKYVKIAVQRLSQEVLL